jgi:putative ABC transport system permease protein
MQYAGMHLLLALSGIRGTFSLNQISAAALAFALSLAVGLGVMVESFKITLERWIEHTFQADVYIKAEQKNLFRPDYLPSELYPALRVLPETLSISRYSAKLVELSNTAVLMGATDFDIGDKHGQYRLIDGSLSEVIASKGLAVGVSEPAAKRLRLRIGSSITFLGPQTRVAAIFRDYSSEQGMILMHYPDYERLFGELPAISLGVYGRTPQAVQSILDALNSKSWTKTFKATRSDELRQLVRRIFTETFRITSLIEIVVLAMCMLGLFSSSIQRLWQRRTELQILQKLGSTPAMLKSSFLLETLLLLLPSLVGGVLGGCVLAAVLVYLINPLSFGWTIDWELSFAVLARNAGAYVMCGILVSAIAMHFTRTTKKMRSDSE